MQVERTPPGNSFLRNLWLYFILVLLAYGSRLSIQEERNLRRDLVALETRIQAQRLTDLLTHEGYIVHGDCGDYIYEEPLEP